jgi:putative MATE family efflux protein
MLVQVIVSVADGVFVGRLGVDALAAIALVIPFVTLMFNVANGGMGGGVAASIARALGAGRLEEARAIVVHSLILAAGFAVGFAVLDWIFAARLFELLGGSGDALKHALSFSHVLFTGSITIWTTAFLAALLRGSGDTATPARVGLVGAFAYVPLSGVLTLGYASWPGLGVVGNAIASVLVAAGTTLFQAFAIQNGRLGFIPTWTTHRLRWSTFQEILGVGIPGCVTTLMSNLTTVVMIGLVARFGMAALAGYGIGARLEYLIGPIAFGIGSGLTTLVGVATGAKDWRRAVKVAWTGGLTAFAIIGLIGWLVAALPEIWLRLFKPDDLVAAASRSYIRHVAPFFCLFGLGLSLNFASQGAGRMTVPLLASFARMATATFVGWIVVEKTSFGLDGLFGAIALGLVVYGCLIAGSLLVRPWREKTDDGKSRMAA